MNIRELACCSAVFVAAASAPGCAAGDAPPSHPSSTGDGGGGGGLVAPDTTSAACVEAAELKTNVGCEYYAVMMDSMFAADNGCFVSFVANTSNQHALLRATFGTEEIDLGAYARVPIGAGKTLSYGAFDPHIGLAPGEVAILFLAGTYASLEPGEITTDEPVPCPVPAAIPVGAQIHGTGIGQAFHITTSTPVVAYQMLPYGGGAAAVTGATLLLPATAWDVSYVAVNAYGADMTAQFGVGPSMNIVAAEDDTHVSLVPRVLIGSGPGVTSAPAGGKVEYTLQAGQVLQLTQAQELTGSPIQSDKPVGLFAGHQCTNTPSNDPYCDHAEQQIPPVRALGHEYAVVHHRSRTSLGESPRYRLIGAADGTVLSYQPQVGGPSAVAFGEVVEFTATGPFVVASQGTEHPFVLLAYMTGATTVANGPLEAGYGDPDVVRVVPPAQYLSHYVFFTDPTYPETNLVVVRNKKDGAFHDVALDCAGTLGDWTPLGSSGEYEYTRTDLVRHDFQPQGGCDNGRREMTSTAPFGVWIWGWGTPETQPQTPDGCLQSEPGFTCYVSYGYPAGEGLQVLNDVEVPVPK